MSQRVPILDVDFHKAERKDIPLVSKHELIALADGVIHAVVASWEVYGDPDRQLKMTTHPEDTRDEPWGFARDMQWGQGTQLVEDFDRANASSDPSRPPKPFHVKSGDK